MRQPDTVYANQLKSRWIKTPHLLLAAAMLFLTACGLFGGGPRLGSQAQLEGAAVLTCSQECADRGQCGTTTLDQRSVVLGGAGGPATSFHDLTFPAGVSVNINGTDIKTLETIMTGEQFPLTFYHVTAPEQGKSGWIAGWCIATP